MLSVLSKSLYQQIILFILKKNICKKKSSVDDTIFMFQTLKHTLEENTNISNYRFIIRVQL